MRPRLFFALMLGVTVCVTAQGHHLIGNLYDSGKRVSIEGTVVRFEFINPHPLLTLDVKDDVKDANGKSQRWRLEMDNRSILVELGFKAETLKEGDRLVVIGDMDRKQAHSLYVRRIDRPSDGFTYQHH